MNDLGFHIGLFLFIGLAIVFCSAIYAENDDTAALKSLPRRFGYFVVGCGLLTVVMLVCEHVFAALE